MFLLVPVYPGCPGSKAVKRSLLFSWQVDVGFGQLTIWRDGSHVGQLTLLPVSCPLGELLAVCEMTVG